MAMQITTRTSRTAQALTRLSEIAFAFMHSQALLSGCELGLFDALADGPITVDDLARQIGIKPIACRRLLMMLVHLGLIEGEQGKYRNTDLGQFCSSQSTVNLGHVSRINPFYHMFEYLSGALREYSPRWQQALGTTATDAFASLYADPVRLREFAELMNAMSIPQGQLIAECFDFASHKCVMDVAGGPGGQAIQIGLKHPHLRGIITDLEPVCAVAQEYIRANGLAPRFTAVVADLIAGPYPAGADVILLGHILHDWSDETCCRILRNCAAALPPKGVLLISESVLRPDYSGSTVAHMKDLTMLIANEPGARERSEQEYRSLLDATGFEAVDLVRLDAPRDLLVAKKR
jgi:DNA-binding Lrp family transcriptional regulator